MRCLAIVSSPALASLQPCRIRNSRSTWAIRLAWPFWILTTSSDFRHGCQLYNRRHLLLTTLKDYRLVCVGLDFNTFSNSCSFSIDWRKEHRSCTTEAQTNTMICASWHVSGISQVCLLVERYRSFVFANIRIPCTSFDCVDGEDISTTEASQGPSHQCSCISSPWTLEQCEVSCFP